MEQDVQDVLAESLTRVKPSATVGIAQKAREMRAAGREVISLSAGEPDFETPPNVRDAAIAAIMRGETRYTNTNGIPELITAVQKKFREENGLEYDKSELIVVPGAKFGVVAALMATLNVNDEVIIPAPYWVSYPDMTLIAGGTPVIVDTSQDDGFLLTPEALERAITPRTRWLILNSPSNPCGAVYPRERVMELAKVLARHKHVWLMTDDIYEHIVYDGAEYTSPAAVAGIERERTCIVNGVSKAFAMTGWRIGYCAAPKVLIQGMCKLQSQLMSHATSIAQWAAVEALNGPHGYFSERAAIFQHRRDLVVNALAKINGIECFCPQGAFYVFPSCRGMIGRTSAGGTEIVDDVAFATAMLEEAEVAVVPGAAFGLSPYFRISYATATERLDEACKRIRRFCEQAS